MALAFSFAPSFGHYRRLAQLSIRISVHSDFRPDFRFAWELCPVPEGPRNTGFASTRKVPITKL